MTYTSPRKLSVLVAGTAAAVLLTEIMLTRLFSVLLFYHFSFLAVALALFGLAGGSQRRWMNKDGDGRGSSGINILWPDREDDDFKSALADAAAGMTPNNISPVITYSVKNGPTMAWMGDLETDFMEKIVDKVNIGAVDILLAPHHGRTSGKVPDKWLRKMSPSLIVIGNAPSEYLHYYSDYDIITQNSAGDVLFQTDGNAVRIYVGESTYSVNFLTDEGFDHTHGLYYIGSLYV